MKEFKYVITDKEGIHARPAGELIKVVKGFNSTIKIAKDGKEADCKRMFAVMGLGVKNGQEVVFTFDGFHDAGYDLCAGTPCIRCCKAYQ